MSDYTNDQKARPLRSQPHTNKYYNGSQNK